MKLILSRKGFDSANGGMPSPILPDGTLLSLPIPSEDASDKLGSLYWEGKSYFDIIKSLKPRTKLQADTSCHLDPDLRRDCKQRTADWQPAFGQVGAALSSLRNEGVEKGDLFLFFGWFKQTELRKGELKFVKGAPDLHIVYGYMQVGDIVNRKEDIPLGIGSHPHVFFKDEWEKGQNAVFLASDTLSLNPNLSGCGVLDFRSNRILTKQGKSRTRWDLPHFFKEVDIKGCKNPWKEDYFQSAAIGQEFIMEATDEIADWARQIIE